MSAKSTIRSLVNAAKIELEVLVNEPDKNTKKKDKRTKTWKIEIDKIEVKHDGENVASLDELLVVCSLDKPFVLSKHHK